MIYLTRHGQTDWNALDKVMGNVNMPLNIIGVEQAKQVRDGLLNTKIDLIICSPLLRTKQTAEIINENRNIEVIYDDRILERDFGEFEGKSIQDFDFVTYWDYYEDKKYDRSENIQNFFNRIYSFLDDIISKHKDKNILLVTHGGVGIAAECYFNKNIPVGSLIDSNLSLGNCEVKKYETI